MVILRILAQILIAGALMLLGADALQSLEAGRIDLRSLSEFAVLLGLPSPAAALQNWESGGFFRDGLLYLVLLPAWTILGLIGVALAWALGPGRDG